MKNRIIVLGAGMVGKAIIYDLSEKYEVTAVDVDENALTFCSENYNVDVIHKNLDDKSCIKEIIKDYDLVVSAVPGFMGYKTLKAVIENDKDIVDISFMPEDFTQLDDIAKKNGVTAIADCGVAPGMPNIIVGYYNNHMKIRRFKYMVGGLPKERKFPFEYKAPFSPIDVIEEYKRPARLKQAGEIIEKPAMSDSELVYFDGLGHLEAFNTDGLRSLLYTMKNIPFMKEKTLRYPGHIRLIQALQAAGFFKETAVKVGNNEIKPIDFTNQLLFDQWKLEPDDDEFTIMRIVMNGILDDEHVEIIYDLLDEFDKGTGLSSMGRTTGFTATAAVSLIDEEIFTSKGVFPPEIVGKDENSFHFIMNYLRERNILYNKTVIKLD